jgi:hypothetical protein
MARKFYRTIIEVEVLSEDPYQPNSLEDVAYDIVYGDCSGAWRVVKQKELNEQDTVEALINQGSDPSFFMIREE